MKIKFGDLSVSQLSRICETMHNCAECPLQNVCAEEPYGYFIDEYVEVELEGKNDAEIQEEASSN